MTTAVTLTPTPPTMTTKTGCGMTATGEDDDLISPQRFKAGDVKYPYLGMPIGLELYKT